mgnify:CR=1 FL=1
MRSLTPILILVIALVMTTSTVFAAPFSDVPANHPYAVAIDAMLRAGVVKGNPSNLFRPEDSVNRAELLTMLYRAIGKSPRAVSSCPFSDVQSSAWYALVVCDAVLKDTAYVKGYPDGTFHPEHSVTRAEALSMILKVMSLQTPEVSEDEVALYKLTDVPASSWFAKLVISAHRNGMLPAPTINGPQFQPSRALTRAEAAGMIASGLTARGAAKTSSSRAINSSIGIADTPIASSARSSSASSQIALAKTVSMPFSDRGVFTGKQSMSYHFSVPSQAVTVALTAAITGTETSDIICRLYLLNESGFSDHYFLGMVDNAAHTCVIKASLESGAYQLQLQPTVAGVPFSVSGEYAVSDGSDGFINATDLQLQQAKTGVLDTGDVYDVYSFTIAKESIYTVEVSPSDLSGIIYLPPSFDQFGFSGPQVNKPYSFTPGKYYLVLTHPRPLSASKTYTVIIRQ